MLLAEVARLAEEVVLSLILFVDYEVRLSAELPWPRQIDLNRPRKAPHTTPNMDIVTGDPSYPSVSPSIHPRAGGR